MAVAATSRRHALEVSPTSAGADLQTHGHWHVLRRRFRQAAYFRHSGAQLVFGVAARATDLVALDGAVGLEPEKHPRARDLQIVFDERLLEECRDAADIGRETLAAAVANIATDVVVLHLARGKGAGP